jgi:galactofuranose transport system substrate-binding protein
MKIFRILLLFVICMVILSSLGCAQQLDSSVLSIYRSNQEPKAEKKYEDLIVGYAQLGAESEWRVANTSSVKETAELLNVELRFLDAQQKQENQIEAIRKFIIQRVDVIGVSPIVETGWVQVFQEAKDAGIPIILVDRRAAVPEDMYVSYLGSDFLEEGRKAANIMVDLVGGQANIVELVGTIGSAPANDRYKGFREVLKDHPGIIIIDSASGDFTRARGKEVMAGFLRKHGTDITAVYAHNDDMALGAIQAIEEYGLKPGKDIIIVSVDAARGAFEAMIAGKLNATVECNPLLGPQFFELALKVVNGQTVPKWVPSIETVFFPEDASSILPTRKY